MKVAPRTRRRGGGGIEVISSESQTFSPFCIDITPLGAWLEGRAGGRGGRISGPADKNYC